MLEMSDAATTMDWSKEAKRAMQLLSDEINSVSFIYDADLRHLEELHSSGAGEDLAESMYFLLCNHPTM